MGNPFDPSELDDTFWGTFEASLSNVDAERINLFFIFQYQAFNTGILCRIRNLQVDNLPLAKVHCIATKDEKSTFSIREYDTLSYKYTKFKKYAS